MARSAAPRACRTNACEIPAGGWESLCGDEGRGSDPRLPARTPMACWREVGDLRRACHRDSSRDSLHKGSFFNSLLRQRESREGRICEDSARFLVSRGFPELNLRMLGSAESAEPGREERCGRRGLRGRWPELLLMQCRARDAGSTSSGEAPLFVKIGQGWPRLATLSARLQEETEAKIDAPCNQRQFVL